MRRYHEEQHIIERNHRLRLQLLGNKNGKRQTQRGRYRKMDGLDCGNSRCACCHMDKYGKDAGAKRRTQDFAFREQLAETTHA